MKEIEIYTDGSCSGNPGPGGWGVVLIYGPFLKTINGGEAHTTNNQMELASVIHALDNLKEKCKVKLYSDSNYVIKAFTEGWIDGWIAKGWKNSQKKPVANRELWEKLIKLVNKHEVEFIKVPGHAGNQYNELADTLAVEATEKTKKEMVK